MSELTNTENLFDKLADEGPVGADKLLREEEILTEEDMKKPSSCNPTTSDDANKKPKKPCANCTCGLAEQESSDEVKASTETTTTKSCGSCYLGDAFRCASCPYKGMPAFKPGEKVTIDTTSDE